MPLYRPVEVIKDSSVLRELQRIAEVIQFLALRNLEVRATPPEKPGDGDTAIADGVNWNPIGDGVKRPVWFNATLGQWQRFTV